MDDGMALMDAIGPHTGLGHAVDVPLALGPAKPSLGPGGPTLKLEGFLIIF